MMSDGIPEAVRGRPRAFDRDVALDGAVRLFWRKGYEATSVRDLSEELGIGQPSLYNTFGDKRGLFDEALRVYERTYGDFIAAALREERTASRSIRRVFEEAPARYTRRGLPPGCLVTSGDAGSTDAQVRAAASRLREAKAMLVREKIESDIAATVLPSDTDAAAVAGYVLTTLNGLAQLARDGASRRELASIADVAASALP